MFNKILVAVDGSEHSTRAVKAAIVLAEKFQSRVTLLNVISFSATNPGLYTDMSEIPQILYDNLEQESRKVLDRAAELFQGMQVTTVIREGHPAGEIISESTNGYNLIILGSRGLGTISGFLLGSVSDRVSHHAKCPVLIVR